MEKMPNSTCWNITSRCNDSCQFCYREQNSMELPYAEQLSVIDRIAESGIKKLTFAGGEPLLITRIEDLILYAKSKGLIVSMTSNAILMNDEKLKFCLEHLDWLTLSLDGATEEVQQRMTRNAGHAERVRRIFEKACSSTERKCRIKINTVVSRLNCDEVKDIAKLVDTYGVDRWKLFQFTPIRGNARKTAQKFEITDERFYQSVEEVKKHLGNHETILSVSDSNNIENAYFVIFPNGDIRISSEMHDQMLGNVLTDNLQEIWENGGYLKQLHEERTGFINE